MFVTINVPGGSNNGADVWYGAPSASQAQTDEQASRTGADIRWLDAAFVRAAEQHAKGVVIATQADMWDLDGKTPAHLTNYEPIISTIASLTTAFARPVLLFFPEIARVLRDGGRLGVRTMTVGDAVGLLARGSCAPSSIRPATIASGKLSKAGPVQARQRADGHSA